MMAKLTNTESRRLYSWWWDSHISPKNSKWLQENLTDMDTKVKTMIKLIEEDADSFARRAEMYYKKRPELMKLVEEFYRAYRALAERYDHATGALRQAQRTMAEAFPNQIPPMLSDEPPSPSTESASHSRAIFDADDSLKPHNNRMNRPYSEEHDASPSKTGLKQVNGKFGNEEKPPHAKFSEGRSVRGLNFQHEGNTSSLVCAENTEAKVQSLKETISKSESEKEAALLQHRIALENISNMETEIFRYQQELKKLDDEMLTAASNLKISEERCLLLEKTNQSLRSELDALKERAREQSEELKNKQEEARLLAFDVESGVVKLKDMELSKMGVEEEIHHLKEENCSLNEQILSSALKIISLQDEIILLKDSIVKLEYEVGLHEEEKRALQQEIANTKKDKVELEQRHHLLTEQIGTVTRNLESLQTMVEELRNRNTELKEICKKNEEEKNVHLESLKLMETISEKNLVLENSLSDANAEIEGSREKIKMLEYSFGSLNGMISVHLSEKVLLVSQVEFITKEMEKLYKNSALLENSLSDVNAELDSLRVNSKDLEASCQSLFAQNCTLLSEKDTLVSQVERAIRNLETLETRYSVLEHKYLNLENEKELALDEIMELEDSFKREKGEYETLIMSIMLSSNSQVSSLENKILVLQEKAQLREKELDAEQQNIIKVETENFIFQRCLHDISEKNSVLSIACRRHLRVLKCTEKLISELRQELVVQGNKLASSLELNEKLRKGIVLMSRELNIVNKDFSSLNGVEDESILEPMLHEIRELVNSILHARNESQHLHLENSIIMTILTQCGLQAIELRNEKDALERESEIKTKGLSVLQSKELELLELNEKLKMELQGGNQRQEVLKAEMAVLNAKLTDSQDANCTLETEIRKILEEKYSLSKLFYDLKERNETVEEENSVVLAELMTMECLYLIFKNSNEEKASELQFSRNHLARLQEDKNELYQEIGQAIEKLVAAEVENIHLKETVVSLQGFSMILENDLNTTRKAFEQSKLEIESSKYVLAQKDGELLQTDQKLKSMQEGNTLLHTRLEGLQLDLDNIMVVREELENKIIILLEGNAVRDCEITGLRQDNGMMDKELNQLRKEVEDLKTKEGHLNYEIKNQIDEVKSCEVEIATLLNDAHITKVNAAIFEEKVLELLMTHEISTMVQREALHEQITLRNADINQLKERLVSMEGETGVLKEEMNAYMLPITALSDDIASLEEHTLLLANHHTPNHPEKHENLMMFRHHSSSSQEPSDNHTAIATARHIELLKLREKVKTLDKLVVNTGNLIEQERFESNANLEAAMREIEALKSEVNSTGSKDITKVNYEQMMKDIQLDRCSNNGVHEPRSISNAGTDDQMSGSWETTERDLDRPIQNGTPVTTVHEIEYHPIPIESTTEKEVGIDKLQLSQRSAESHQEWNKRVIERLSSDAQRLSLLQTAVEELKRDMETSEMNRSPKSFEFDRVKAQLKESEGVVSQLIGTNRDLVRKAEELLNASSDSRVLGASEMQRGSRRTVSEKVRRGSETIGRLELDLQKIEYILLKLKEEHENNRRIATGRRRVLLQDYLFGRMDGKKQKKRRSCCLRPKTKDD